MNVVRRFLHGELDPLTAGLAVALLGSAVTLGVFRLLMVLAGNFAGSLVEVAVVQLTYYVGCALVLALAVWGVLATAVRHRGKAGAWLAGGLVASGLVVVPIAMKTAVTARELGQIAAGHDPLGQPVTIRRVGQELLLSGPIAQGSANRFAASVGPADRGRTLVLDSIGGRLFEATEIVKVVKRLHLNTRVDGFCASACTNIYLAGQRRSADAAASLGFHRPTQDGNSDLDDRLLGLQASQLMRDAGVAEKFVKQSMATASGDLWVPEMDALVDAGVVQDVSFERGLQRVGQSWMKKPTALDPAIRLVGFAEKAPTLQLRFRWRGRPMPLDRLAERIAEPLCADVAFAGGARVTLIDADRPIRRRVIDSADCDALPVDGR